jgi:hypothetical protein
MTVTTEFLRRSLDRILGYLEENGVTELSLDEDYYWHIPKEQRYNPGDEPNHLTLGQLSDDLDLLQKIDQGALPPLRLNLGQLAAVLLLLGEADEPL